MSRVSRWTYSVRGISEQRCPLTLSRRPDFIPKEDHDNENRILLLESMFINLIDLDLQNRIAKSKNYDFDVKNALKILLEKGLNTLQSNLEDWKLEKHNGENMMFYKGKNYNPNDLDLRQDIVKMFHDHEMAGHPGELETFNSVKQYYWWPGMQTSVK